jgi:thioredoxin-like negative regulator of GroEL
MKAVALYRPNSDHARTLEEYVHDFDRQKGKEVELISLDTVQGTEMANLYGIMEYPAILVIRDDGQLVKDWQGTQMPLMDDVAGHIEA